mmetsp:Transcript_147587/g.367900  ORF Transcript_147587/g.367900 Transcript_147587/m.367900 type:complete len:231 (-) Transcript_147587:1174-1866(-)
MLPASPLSARGRQAPEAVASRTQSPPAACPCHSPRRPQEAMEAPAERLCHLSHSSPCHRSHNHLSHLSHNRLCHRSHSHLSHQSRSHPCRRNHHCQRERLCHKDHQEAVAAAHNHQCSHRQTLPRHQVEKVPWRYHSEVAEGNIHHKSSVEGQRLGTLAWGPMTLLARQVPSTGSVTCDSATQGTSVCASPSSAKSSLYEDLRYRPLWVLGACNASAPCPPLSSGRHCRV